MSPLKSLELFKFIDIEGRMVVPGGWGNGVKGVVSWVQSFSSARRNSTGGLFCQQCEYTQCHWTIYLKMVKTVDFITCVFIKV